MRQHAGHDAEMADYRAERPLAARSSARRGEVLPARDSAAASPDFTPGDPPAHYRYSSVEERWEIRLQPDGSAHASVMVRREQQLARDRGWRLIARRGLPGLVARRTHLWLAAAGAGLAALVAGGWLAASAWPRPAPQPQTVTIAMPPPMVMMAPPPIAPPAARRDMPQPAASDPVRADMPRVPVVLPSPGEQDIAASSAPATPDSRPLDRRPAVKAAIARAFASGEPEAWAEGDLTGFVVVGPAEASGGASCRNTVLLVRGGQNGDQTVSRRRCQAANGAISVRDAS